MSPIVPPSSMTHTSGGPYAYRIDDDRYEMIEARTCLAVGYYVFALFDVGGDGMCCAYGRGEYGINLSGRGGGGGGREIRPLSLGRFDGHVDATFFVVSDADVDVAVGGTAMGGRRDRARASY